MSVIVRVSNRLIIEFFKHFFLMSTNIYWAEQSSLHSCRHRPVRKTQLAAGLALQRCRHSKQCSCTCLPDFVCRCTADSGWGRRPCAQLEAACRSPRGVVRSTESAVKWTHTSPMEGLMTKDVYRLYHSRSIPIDTRSS